MADDNDSTEKTLEPTEKRLRDARKKGDVPSSKETGNMVVVVALLGIIAFVLPFQTPKIVDALFGLIEQSASLNVAAGAPGVTRLGQVMSDFATNVVIAIAPMFAVLVVGAAIGAVIQGETVISFERIRPKLSKLSPAEGLKRLFSANLPSFTPLIPTSGIPNTVFPSTIVSHQTAVIVPGTGIPINFPISSSL